MIIIGDDTHTITEITRRLIKEMEKPEKGSKLNILYQSGVEVGNRLGIHWIKRIGPFKKVP